MIKKPATTLRKTRFKLVYVGKSLIGSDFSKERPEMLGGIEFRGVRGCIPTYED